MSGVDPATIGRAYNFEWNRGLASRARDRSAATARSYARRSRRTTLGGRRRVHFDAGREARRRARRAGRLRARRPRPAARRRRRLAGGVRPQLPAAGRRATRSCDGRLDGSARAGARRLPRREAPDAATSSSTSRTAWHGRRDEPASTSCSRCRVIVSPVRDGEHARARPSSSGRVSSGCCAPSG